MVFKRIFFYKLSIVFFLFVSKISFAQVILNVMEKSRKPISQAVINIKSSDSVSQQFSDLKGQVIINQKQGKYQVTIGHPSYMSSKFELELGKKKDTLDVILIERVNQLEEVLVQGPSVSQVIKESYYSPEVIDFKNFRNSSKTVVEALNLGAGLRIQQQGGMGSDLNVIINGIDGKDVKVFLDEIPVYLLGRGSDLQNLSVNMIERVEIYKGLIPVQFGSDALGGIINIVTKKNEKNSFGLGYMYGSWNSHEATANIYTHPFRNKKIFTTIDAVYRHSDNDYWMDDVDVVVDDFYNTKKGRAKRFNDDYDFTLTNVKIGAKDLKWADHIQFFSSFTHTNKEWQHGITAIKPWGEPFSKEYTGGAALNWKKSSSRNNRWQIDVTAGYNFEQIYFEDVSSRIYFWDGTFVEGNKKGESGLYSEGRTLKTYQHVIYGRENAFFKISDRYKINVSLLTTKRELTGEDKAGTATYKEDPFKTPQTLLNNFFGTSLESNFLENHLIANTSFKHYYSKVKAVNFKITNEFDKLNTSSSSNIGFGQAIKWMVDSKLSILPGYEYTVRQPDNTEIFGDYIAISPNPNLKPAKSHNLNFKVHYKSPDQKIFTGAGAFYRNTKNRILLTSFSNALATHTNLLQTSTIGGECFLEYKLNTKVDLNINTTYLDSRLGAVDHSGIFTEEYVGARIPNTPYLFSNMHVSYTLNSENKRNYDVRFLYTASYVHEYFLTWAINGIKSSKTIIPTQFVNDFSMMVYPKNEKWNFAVDCKNLTNARVYDNFSVQKAGRSFYAKVTYSIH